MRAHLPAVADETVSAIIAEVPGYAGALRGAMGENIRSAVQVALGGFLSLAAGRPGTDARTPTAPAVEGAYQLGRGEARSGRTTEALLAAYRIGARVSWREMSTTRCAPGVDAATLVPSRSWSSPTSTSSPRPASPATPTSSRPRAGCASAGWSGSPATCSTAPR